MANRERAGVWKEGLYTALAARRYLPAIEQRRVMDYLEVGHRAEVALEEERTRARAAIISRAIHARVNAQKICG